MLELFLILPVIICVILFLIQNKSLNIAAIIIYAAISAVYSVSFLYIKESSQIFNGITGYLKIDNLNILFLAVQNILFLGVTIYNIDYLKSSSISNKISTIYSIFLLLFVFSMTGVIISSNLGLMWVFAEATTLTSVYLIYMSGTKASLEAAWKYLFICSIGIALAFVGVIFLSIGTGNLNSLFFSDLYGYAPKIAPQWMRLAFVFLLIGFGTKVGLAPVHAWLPDAHSEAPSVISALLSGALLNSAMLAIIRVYKLSLLSEIKIFAENLMLLMGFLSLFVCAVFVLRVKNYKRMLAYSSIENMGIILIGIAIGGVGYFAAMLHVVAHSLIKGSFFLTSGNILHRFSSKEIDSVKGLLQKDNCNAWLWIICFCFISGIPPSPVFLSEFLILSSVFSKGYYALFILFCLLLTIIIYGMGRAVFQMSFGNADITVSENRLSLTRYISPIFFLIFLTCMGLYMPRVLFSVIDNAAKLLGG